MTPTLADLTARFLARAAAPVAATEVEPHEVAGGFRAAPADAWRDATAGTAAGPAPAEWAAYCGLDAVGLVPCAAGLVPQRVRTVAVPDITAAPTPLVAGLSSLKTWVSRSAAAGDAGRALVAAGVAAGLGDHAAASFSLDAAEQAGGKSEAWHNQAGACAWLAGRPADAAEHWSRAGDGAPARFNRGLTALAAGNRAAAVTDFTAAAAGLPESGGWHHLARLYAAIAG